MFNFAKNSLTLIAFALVTFLLALSFHEANAAGTTANVSWVAPTSYLDGSSLPASDIASYTVTWVGKSAALSGSKTVTGTSTTVTVPCDGTTFTVTVTTTATALYPSVTSDPSASKLYATGVACRPLAPTGLSVT
jgi:hypothetical protein